MRVSWIQDMIKRHQHQHYPFPHEYEYEYDDDADDDNDNDINDCDGDGKASQCTRLLRSMKKLASRYISKLYSSTSGRKEDQEDSEDTVNEGEDCGDDGEEDADEDYNDADVNNCGANGNCNAGFNPVGDHILGGPYYYNQCFTRKLGTIVELPNEGFDGDDDDIHTKSQH